MSHFIQKALHYADQLNRQEWALVLIAVVVIGFLCLRGFGSRKEF